MAWHETLYVLFHVLTFVAYLSTQCLEWANVPWSTPSQARDQALIIARAERSAKMVRSSAT